MHIVIVGGGTAGWATALIAATRHKQHQFTLIESSKIGVVGVGESTTGRMTDLLLNIQGDYGCDLNEFIIETGATMKYGIRHRGWTTNINQEYVGPIDGSWTHLNIPDPLFTWGVSNLGHEKLLTTAKCGWWIDNQISNFNKSTHNFLDLRYAMHVDAHLVGKYFKKLSLRKGNVRDVDDVIKKVNLDSENGNIKSLLLEGGEVIEGDFFIDCTGFNKILMKELDTKWVSYQDKLPLNSAIPFLTDYKKDEVPDMCTLAWAQKNGWMWNIPLIDRKGCGYVFCDAFTSPDKAQEEIETILGHTVDVSRVIKFDSGRQAESWVKNCLAIGLSSAFLEPLEATSIHSSIVQAQYFAHEFLKSTKEETLNDGSRKIHNRRVAKIYDDIKDFIVMHYMGGRDDSEFWKYIKSGITKTDFVSELVDMSKTKMPTTHDFPSYDGSAGWPLYSYVMAGIGLMNKTTARNELHFDLPLYGPIENMSAMAYYDLQDQWAAESKDLYTYKEFIQHFRDLRYQHGFSNKQY
jgi:tryptophan 6-halogenase